MTYSKAQVEADIKRHEGLSVVLNHSRQHFVRLYSEVYETPVDPEAPFSIFLDRLKEYCSQYCLRLV